MLDQSLLVDETWVSLFIHFRTSSHCLLSHIQYTSYFCRKSFKFQLDHIYQLSLLMNTIHFSSLSQRNQVSLAPRVLARLASAPQPWPGVHPPPMVAAQSPTTSSSTRSRAATSGPRPTTSRACPTAPTPSGVSRRRWSTSSASAPRTRPASDHRQTAQNLHSLRSPLVRDSLYSPWNSHRSWYFLSCYWFENTSFFYNFYSW